MLIKVVYGAFGVIGIALGGGATMRIIGIPPPAAIVHGLLCLSLCTMCCWGACWLYALYPEIEKVMKSDQPFATKMKTVKSILGPFLGMSDRILAMHKITGGK